MLPFGVVMGESDSLFLTASTFEYDWNGFRNDFFSVLAEFCLGRGLALRLA